jgi:putative membrane protein
VLFLLGGVVALLGLVLLGGVAPLRYRHLRRTIGRGPTSAPALAALATLVVLAAAGAAVTVIAAA